MRGNHSFNRFAVLFQSGTVRSLRPFPLILRFELTSRVSSPTRAPMISDTRAPVLYIVANKTRSRCPFHDEGLGAESTPSVSSRERKPIRGRSYRLVGMARIR